MGKLLDVKGLLSKAEQETMPEYGIVQSAKGNEGASAGIAEIVEGIKTGRIIHFMSEGAWSHHQLVEAVLQFAGPAHVCVSSYAMSETSVRMLSRYMEFGGIKSLHAVIDNRIETRTAGSLQLMTAIASSYALVPCHAKVTTIMCDKASILIIGSANYTENKRIEAGIAMDSLAGCVFHSNWIRNKIEQHGRK